ncbi:magnesium-transporting ATPase (P-type) [Arthrobacter ulcerisalmonis]|nr:magnesium-transporting ATPase (P-type) [Arthrobacter ulcerisalmonis]
MKKTPLPAWARIFRTILLVLAGILLLLLLLLLLITMGTSRAGDMYDDNTMAVFQATIWLGLALTALTIPYLLASVTYGALWAAKLRGRGYRGYPATTWILVVGPLVVGLSVMAVVALVAAPPSML